MIQSATDPISGDINEHLQQVVELLESGDLGTAEQTLNSMESTTRTIVLSRLPEQLRQQLLTGIDPEHAATYLHNMPEVQAVELLGEIEPAAAADILEELPKSEQADLVGELSQRSMDSILSEMPAQDASTVRTLAEYEDEEAGGIMIVRFVAVDETQTVRQVVDKLQANAAIYSDFSVQYVYVVDRLGKIKGVLPLRSLLLSPGNVLVTDVMIREPLSVSVHTPLKDLHQFFTEHKFVGVPVVDEQARLVGVLRRGDVEEAMATHYAEDYLKTQGIVNEELRTMPLVLRSRRRLAWLSINIFLNIIAASVIAFYQETLAQVIALAVFLPIISDMSGCSGNQAVAVSMRELSLGLVNANEVIRVWIKELGVGLINGLALGCLIAAVAFLWKGNPWLGAVVGLAMMINTIVAVSLGGTLPLIMRRLNMDPALASGPILTTVTDMCGFFLVLSCAAMWIDKLV